MTLNHDEQILQFWFGKNLANPLQNSKQWWQKNEGFDQQIKHQFESDLLCATRGEYDDWLKTPRGSLAYIILLDQFSRNIYRNTPQSFAQDPLALSTSLRGQKEKQDRQLSPVERWFFYMPMMHSEDIEVQKGSVEVFRQLAEEVEEKLRETFQFAHQYAVKHFEIIERFGRFPHRNAILGRTSTPAEMEFLKQPGSSF